MITRKTLAVNFISFGFSSFCCFLPVTFAWGGFLQRQFCKWKVALYKIWLAFSALHAIFLGITLLLSFTTRQDNSDIKNLPVHTICLLGGANAINWSIHVFHRNTEVFTALFNDTIDRLATGKAKIQSLQDLVVLTSPGNFLCASFLYLACMGINHTSPQYLCSFVNFIDHQVGLFITCLAVICDYVMFLFWVCTYDIALCTQLLFFQTCELELDKRIAMLRRTQRDTSSQQFKTHCTSLQKLQLRVNLLNHTFSSLIYSFKMVTITICIIGFFFFLKLSSTHVLIAVANFCLAIISCLSYAVVYDRGFQISLKARKLKTELHFSTGRLCKMEQRYLHQILHSIREARVMVGSFYAMERDASMTYIGFCVVALCNMIISFPQRQ